MTSIDSESLEAAENHVLRSVFMEKLIASPPDTHDVDDLSVTPRLLIQFWDDATSIPRDVQLCLDSWSPLEGEGFTRLLFDDTSAEEFVRTHFSARHLLAFKRCCHPAMRADYFRLGFILKCGGFYIDADDEYQGLDLDNLVGDGRLRLQPLCYEIASDSMVDPFHSVATEEAKGRIFYVNNNPLIAPPEHPIIAKALERATSNLLLRKGEDRDIQSLTGPGNITTCLVAHAIERELASRRRDYSLLTNWDSVAISKWPLEYRLDHRNWRLWRRGVRSRR